MNHDVARTNPLRVEGPRGDTRPDFGVAPRDADETGPSSRARRGVNADHIRHRRGHVAPEGRSRRLALAQFFLRCEWKALDVGEQLEMFARQACGAKFVL